MKSSFIKKYFSYSYFVILIQIFLGLIILYFLCENHSFISIIERKLGKLPESVNFLSKNFPFGFYGFGKWSRNPSIDAIYLSYPISSYWMSGLFRNILSNNIKTTEIIFWLNSITYLLIPVNLALITFQENKTNVSNFFKINIACLFLLSNPSFLSVFTSPDWFESFMLFCLLGIFLSNFRKFTIASIICFSLAGFSNPYTSISLIIGSIIINICSFIKDKKFIDKKILIKILRLPNNKIIKSKISLIPILSGVLFFLLLRIFFALDTFQITDLDGMSLVQGSALQDRMAIGKDVEKYGGIFTLFKFILPIKLNALSDIFKTLLSGEVRIDWIILNELLKIISYLIINISGLFYFLKKIIIKINNQNTKQEIIFNTGLNIYAISILFYIVIFPDIASNHALFIARLISPIIAFGLCSLIFDFSYRLIRNSYHIVLSVIISWIVVIDNLNFFISLILEK